VAKDQAGSFIGEQTQVVTKAATDTTDAAKQKAGETAQYIQDRAADAVQYAKSPAATDKEAPPTMSAASVVVLPHTSCTVKIEELLFFCKDELKNNGSRHIMAMSIGQKMMPASP
jgi:hypothetical protein